MGQPNRSPDPISFTVDGTRQQLAGQSPTGFTFLNASSSSQTIWIGNSTVTATSSGDTAGFPLAAGAAIDRARFDNLASVYVIASASGAVLVALPL